MRLLIDNALSPQISIQMSRLGHDCVHVRDRGMQAADDAEVFSVAESEQRVLVSADTDFGALLALRQKAKPSFILFRRTIGLAPENLGRLLHATCLELSEDLERGCIVTITDDRMRVRPLPIE